MTDEKHNDSQSLLDRPITFLLRLLRLEVLGDVWKGLRKVISGRPHKGLYEVQEYESTLELKDQGGKRAILKKRDGDKPLALDYKCALLAL